MLLFIKRALLTLLKSVVLHLRPWAQSLLSDKSLPIVAPDGALTAFPMRYIDNLQDLDVELRRVKDAFSVSDDVARQTMSQFCYVAQHELPENPYSEAYRLAQMHLYLTLSKREAYSPEVNERSHFDLDSAKYCPFPYNTLSPTTTGDQLIAQGFVIRAMGLPPGAKIVEFGPGWGNLTLELARLGYQVTAVEVEPDFVKLIQHRASQLGQRITTIQCDMLEFQSSEPYDVALFFESFHHCSDHVRLLKNLTRLVKDNGQIVFASEPITPLPHPWGVRLDGMSLLAIREWGWLELGFDSSYFLRTLLLFGWSPIRFRSEVSHLADIIVASRSQLFYEPHKLTLPPDEEQTWALRCAEGLFTSRHSSLSSAHDVPVKAVEFCVSNHSPKSLVATFMTEKDSITAALVPSPYPVSITLPVSSWTGALKIASSTWMPKPGTKYAAAPELGVMVHSVRLIC